MSIAVIIPVFNEQAALSSMLEAVLILGFEEIVLVDGESQDRSVEVAKAVLEGTPLERHRILSAPRGRASQMNAGAAQATADILLFLHADTQLPENTRTLIKTAMADSHCVGGRFDVRFPIDRGYAWLVSRFMNLRSRLSGISTGDQAIFVRRSVFKSMGGFSEIPLMEDIEFSRRLKKLGTIVALRERVIASFRRWEQQGPLRTIVRMWALRFLFWAGWDPRHLQDYYDPVR